MIQNLPFVTDQHRRIPQAPDARARALVKANVCEDLGLRAGLAERADFRAGDEEGLVGEAGEEVVVVDGAGGT